MGNLSEYDACRFCGCPESKVITRLTKGVKYNAIQCYHCGSRSGWRKSLDETKRIWNGGCSFWEDGRGLDA